MLVQMRFDEYLGGLLPQQQAEIRRKLTILAGAESGDQRIAAGIWEEERLFGDVWKALCCALQCCPEAPPDIRAAVRDWGRTPGPPPYALLAEATRVCRECILAWCRVMERFARWMDEHDGVYGGVTAAEDALRRLVAEPSVDVQRRKLGNMPLARHPMWATLSRHDGAADPAEALPCDAPALGACLGLPKAWGRGAMLVFRYTLPNGVNACFPTVASAAGMARWNKSWRAAPLGEPHGWTCPRPGPAGAAVRPLPEVVHQRVSADSLVLPVLRVEPGKAVSSDER